MRAVMLDVPVHLLEERARLGHDRFDEVWNGVLHMVPPPSSLHQDLALDIASFLKPLLLARGIKTSVATGVFRPGSDGKDYRIPDIAFASTAGGLHTRRGIEGAALAVLEILSPDDETYDKFDFWSSLGVAEIVVIQPDTRAVEVHRLRGSAYAAIAPDEHGTLHASAIDVRWTRLAQVPPKLRVQHGPSSTDL